MTSEPRATEPSPLRPAHPPVSVPLLDPDRPVEVDIGCGLGHFLMHRAALHPDIQFVGIERMIDRVRRFNRKIDRAGFAHVQVLRAEATDALEQVFPPNSIDRLFVLFPDPWPKRRHHRRRLFNAAFLDLLTHRLKPLGEVFVATDHQDYLLAIQACFDADIRFRPIPPLARDPEGWTRFEQIFREQGKPIGECGYRLHPTESDP